MKSLRLAGASCIALSMLALASARAEEPCAKKPCAECCKESAKCPVLKAAEAATARARANRRADDFTPADTSLVDGLFETRIILGGVTPRIVFGDEEPALDVVVADGKCCKKSAACAESKTACEGARRQARGQNSLAIELEIDCPQAFSVQQACRSGGCAMLACEDECPCQPGACRKAQLAQVSEKPCDCCTGAQAVAVDENCAGECPCSGKTCASKTCAASGSVDGQRLPYFAPGSSCSERDACTVKAVTELMDRLGPSVLSGTEFDRGHSVGGFRVECIENQVTIRDELIEHIRALAAEETAPGHTAATCTAYCQCTEPTGPSADECEASIEALRFTAMVLDQAVATLEQHNLYDASDRTRELANQLRQQGRQLRQSVQGSHRRQYEAAPVSCEAPLPSGCESSPTARRAPTFGGAEIRY